MTRTCDVPGCDAVHRAAGYCASHYGRWKRHGDPLATIQEHQSRARKEPGKCGTCERPMRSSQTRIDKAPGTVRRRSGDQCVPCYEASKKRVRLSCAGESRYTEHAEANYAHNRAGLVAYLQDRRRRGIKEDGAMRFLEEAQ